MSSQNNYDATSDETSKKNSNIDEALPGHFNFPSNQYGNGAASFNQKPVPNNMPYGALPPPPQPTAPNFVPAMANGDQTFNNQFIYPNSFPSSAMPMPYNYNNPLMMNLYPHRPQNWGNVVHSPQFMTPAPPTNFQKINDNTLPPPSGSKFSLQQSQKSPSHPTAPSISTNNDNVSQEPKLQAHKTQIIPPAQIPMLTIERKKGKEDPTGPKPKNNVAMPNNVPPTTFQKTNDNILPPPSGSKFSSQQSQKSPFYPTAPSISTNDNNVIHESKLQAHKTQLIPPAQIPMLTIERKNGKENPRSKPKNNVAVTNKVNMKQASITKYTSTLSRKVKPSFDDREGKTCEKQQHEGPIPILENSLKRDLSENSKKNKVTNNILPEMTSMPCGRDNPATGSKWQKDEKEKQRPTEIKNKPSQPPVTKDTVTHETSLIPILENSLKRDLSENSKKNKVTNNILPEMTSMPCGRDNPATGSKWQKDEKEKQRPTVIKNKPSQPPVTKDTVTHETSLLPPKNPFDENLKSRDKKEKKRIEEQENEKKQPPPLVCEDISSLTFEEISKMAVTFAFEMNNEESKQRAFANETKWRKKHSKSPTVILKRKLVDTPTTTPTPIPTTTPAPTKKTKRQQCTPKKVFEGPAEDLPDGWIIRKMQRTGGASSGTIDRYWFSPKNKKFRSMIEIERFMKALIMTNGDEEEAYDLFKRGVKFYVANKTTDESSKMKRGVAMNVNEANKTTDESSKMKRGVAVNVDKDNKTTDKLSKMKEVVAVNVNEANKTADESSNTKGEVAVNISKADKTADESSNM